MPPPRELDLRERDDNYSCSELGVFVNVDKRRTLRDLYHRKIDRIVEPVTPRMRYGKHFEEAIFYAGMEETGMKMTPLFNQTFRHPEWPKYHLIGTPDALAEKEEDGGWDSKLLAFDQRYQYGSPDDAVLIMPPDHELQMRGYMELTRRPCWYIGVWCGDKLWVYRLERDIEFGAFILDHAERLWKRYFEARERPPIGASKLSADWLQRAFPTHKRPDIREATSEEVERLAHYAHVRSQQKAIFKERMLLENQLKEAVADREGLRWPHGTFTWRRTKDSKSIDWQSMAIGLRTHFIKGKDDRETDEMRDKLTADYTHPKPGYRKIRFVSDLEKETDEFEETADAA